MSRVLIAIEGAADIPQKELDERTPLQVGRCVQAARLAEEGELGLLVSGRKVQRHEHLLGLMCGLPEKDAANLTRGSLEAEAVARNGDGFTYAYCGNFVTMNEGSVVEPRVGRLSFEETTALTNIIQQSFDPSELRLIPLAPARVVALVRSDASKLASGESPSIAEHEDALPSGKKGKWIREVLEKSSYALGILTLNDVRLDLGENPATHLWLWGGGPLAASRYSLGRGAVLTQSAMAKGLARLCQYDVFSLKDPWSESTDALFDKDALEKALSSLDFLLVYVEAPKELGGYGNAVEKVRFLERMDIRLLTPLMELLRSKPHVRVMLTTDGFLQEDRIHAPLALWGNPVKADSARRWDERACAEGTLGHVDPTRMFNLLMGT